MICSIFIKVRNVCSCIKVAEDFVSPQVSVDNQNLLLISVGL